MDADPSTAVLPPALLIFLYFLSMATFSLPDAGHVTLITCYGLNVYVPRELIC